jgi:hypothetical protein
MTHEGNPNEALIKRARQIGVLPQELSRRERCIEKIHHYAPEATTYRGVFLELIPSDELSDIVSVLDSFS